MSGDGRYVAFISGASNLVPGDDNFTADVFVFDLQTNTVSRLNIDPAGFPEHNVAPEAVAISADGNRIAVTRVEVSHLAENYAPNFAPGKRQWGSMLEGRSGALIDIFAAVGAQTALVFRDQTDVNDGRVSGLPHLSQSTFLLFESRLVSVHDKI